MRVVYPYVLTLLSLLPVLAFIWIWMLRRAEKRAALFSTPDAVAPRRQMFQLVLLLVALSLLTVAASRPQWGRGEERVLAKGRNLIVALDVSRSMLAKDVHPNRLERAKADVLDLVDELDGDRAALLAFRGKGELICPLTSDYAFFRQALDGVSPESAPRGETDIEDALEKSLAALDPAQDEYSAILLISDGGDLKNKAFDGAKKAAERGVPVFTIGIGSEHGAAIPGADGKGEQMYQGQKVTTKLESPVLREIARISGGRYIALGTAGTADTTLGAIYRRHLRTIAAKEQREAMELRYRERFQWFLIPAIMLFLFAGALSRGRLSGQTKRRIAMLLALLASGAQAETNSQDVVSNQVPAGVDSMLKIMPGRAGARQAQRLFADGKWDEAASAYLTASRGADAEEAEVCAFNAAIAKMKAGKDSEATELLRNLLSSKRFSSRAGALAGKLLLEATAKAEDDAVRFEDMRKAASAFQAALRSDSASEANHRNLARALDRLPEARENAHIAEVLKANANSQPPDLLGKMLAEQRQLRKVSNTVFSMTNAFELIKESENLSKRQAANADLWIALKAGLLQAITNEDAKVEVNRKIEESKKLMRDCVEFFEDVNPAAASAVEAAEPGVYAFWKALAAPPALIDEDMLCQTNAIIPDPETFLYGRDAQNEALQLTKLFRERFPQWAEQYAAQSAQNTNMPPFTAEDRSKVERLSKEVEDLQTPVAGNPLSNDAKVLAYSKLEEIKKLLPKQQNSQQNEQNQQQNQQDDQNQQSSPKQNQPQNQEQSRDEKPNPDRNEKKNEEQQQAAEEVLRRALEREKEHEQQKKDRLKSIPSSPLERDW